MSTVLMLVLLTMPIHHTTTIKNVSLVVSSAFSLIINLKHQKLSIINKTYKRAYSTVTSPSCFPDFLEACNFNLRITYDLTHFFQNTRDRFSSGLANYRKSIPLYLYFVFIILTSFNVGQEKTGVNQGTYQ